MFSVVSMAFWQNGNAISSVDIKINLDLYIHVYVYICAINLIGGILSCTCGKFGCS